MNKSNSQRRISQKEARQLILHYQGLIGNNETTLQLIEQLGYIQIDTISVTERSHNHVLFTRNPRFKQQELLQLMDSKSIFEYWSHAAAYLPMKDFRFSLFKKTQYKNGEVHWFDRDKKVEKYVYDKLKAEGPLQSKDFESPKNANPKWYAWKPAKIALANLFMDGSIMISNRKGFHKLFDVTDRVLPTEVDSSIPSEIEFCRYIIEAALRSQGVATLEEIAYLRKGLKKPLKMVLQIMLEEGEIIPVSIDGLDKVYYAIRFGVEQAFEHAPKTKKLHILNPFDNLTIQRGRLKDFFNFDYQIECYVPEPKRKFGYYALPILFGDELVARLDAKADRKSGVFKVNQLWHEPGFRVTQKFNATLDSQLTKFAKFCGCDVVNYSRPIN